MPYDATIRGTLDSGLKIKKIRVRVHEELLRVPIRRETWQDPWYHFRPVVLFDLRLL